MLVIASNTGIGGVSNNVTIVNDAIEPENVSTKPMRPNNVSKKSSKNMATSIDDMKKGYYLLDTNESMKSGVPKYIYLGPKAPNLVFHENADVSSAAEMDE